MLIIESAFTIIDFETTGQMEDYPNAPWQVGMVYFANGRLQPRHSYTSLLNCGDRPFNPYAPGRHAQIRGQILSAPTIQDLWPVLRQWLVDRLLVAHNAATEKKCLGEQFPMHRFGPWVDTLSLARTAYPDAPSHRLGELLSALKLRQQADAMCPGLEAHDALYDACATGILLEHLLHLPGWDSLTIEDLAT